jgi:hypothetical protein
MNFARYQSVHKGYYTASVHGPNFSSGKSVCGLMNVWIDVWLMQTNVKPRASVKIEILGLS